MLNISSEQFRTARQNVQTRYVKIELLNEDFQTVDWLEGICTGGNISIQADSDMRRTGNVQLVIKNSSFKVEPGGRIWFDRYLRIWEGVLSNITGEVVWTNCGLFIIDAPSYHYDVASSNLSLTLLDLMAKLTGARNGNFPGVPVKIPVNSDIREAMISILELFGFKNYIIEDDGRTVPFDLEFGQGATAYEVLRKLCDLYPGYEMFFNTDGTFVFQKIPDGTKDSVVADDSLWEAIKISEDINVDFQGVKNSIEVYGRTHEPSYFAPEIEVSGNQLTLKIASVEAYSENAIYGFVLSSPVPTNLQIRINGLPFLPIEADMGYESGDTYYCIRYVNGGWEYLGHLQPYAKVEDVNIQSPFNVRSLGRIRLALFGGDYDYIYSDGLARQRAEYELYLHTNMNNTIQLNCVPVYWLDVNVKVRYTSEITKEASEYLIKNIDMGLSPADTMSITLVKYYPVAES